MDGGKNRDRKKLRTGVTTGTCAAAAAAAAVRILLSEGEAVFSEVSVSTPGGIRIPLPVAAIRLGSGWAECAVQKYSGDDPDVTDGVLVYCKAQWQDSSQKESSAVLQETVGTGIEIRGGEGIGMVTKPGLACKVGEPAINPVPQQMIRQSVKQVMEEWECRAPVILTISIPAGTELAKRTFNPKLGIQGGISVLGTSGIVEPMSEQALIDTIRIEMNMKRAEGVEYLLLTPGNYGERFLNEAPELKNLSYVKCSNFIADAAEYAVVCGFRGILLLGHIGKLVKVAAGQRNTHSKYGDHRMEILAAYARARGAKAEVVTAVDHSMTTEEAITQLKQADPTQKRTGQMGSGFFRYVMEDLTEAIRDNLMEWTGGALQIAVVCYSNDHGILAQSRGTKQWLAVAADRVERMAYKLDRS